MLRDIASWMRLEQGETAASDAYKSVPIDAKSRVIRLLEVLAFPESGPPSFSFHICKLEAPLSFTALSYTWGDPDSPMHKILIDGKPVFIRQNLWVFFFFWQAYQSEFKWLWVDAVCINQSNTAEGNHQVGLMREIYSMVLEWQAMLDEFVQF